MSEKIEPALSAEEWEYALDPDVRESLAYEVTYLWGKTRPAAAIALANAALPESDPRKITLESVDLLRESAEMIRKDFGRPFEVWSALVVMADALESYLPPA